MIRGKQQVHPTLLRNLTLDANIVFGFSTIVINTFVMVADATN